MHGERRRRRRRKPTDPAQGQGGYGGGGGEATAVGVIDSSLSRPSKEERIISEHRQACNMQAMMIRIIVHPKCNLQHHIQQQEGEDRLGTSICILLLGAYPC
jgi:hypothetical protein